MVLIWTAQIVLPVCLLGYWYVESFNLPEAGLLPQAQVDNAHAAIVAVAVVILVIPVLGCAVAARNRHVVQAWLFAVIFLAGSIADLGVYAIAQRTEPPEPAPVVTQCIPHSDGGHGCPGG